MFYFNQFLRVEQDISTGSDGERFNDQKHWLFDFFQFKTWLEIGVFASFSTNWTPVWRPPLSSIRIGALFDDICIQYRSWRNLQALIVVSRRSCWLPIFGAARTWRHLEVQTDCWLWADSVPGVRLIGDGHENLASNSKYRFYTLQQWWVRQGTLQSVFFQKPTIRDKQTQHRRNFYHPFHVTIILNSLRFKPHNWRRAHRFFSYLTIDAKEICFKCHVC